MSASVTNFPAADKMVKTPSSAATPDKAPEVLKPVEKAPSVENK